MATKFHATDNMKLDLPTVVEYYSGKSVFITGGTGFIGKVLIEKLLRSCPNLDKMYILVRPKRKQTIEQRIEELVISPIFEKLKSEQPNFIKKLVPVYGDMLQSGLGISQGDRETLENNVHLVFHSAADVRFDESLRKALEMNVLAVRKMVQLCQKFKYLEVFVHVSTAYSNCNRPVIEEVVYPAPVEPQKLIDACEWMTDDMIDRITPDILGDKPNTYIYTKHLAEQLLIQEARDIPLAIVRPSVVGAALREPMPGWVDGFSGSTGAFIAIGKGICRSMKADGDVLGDMIPVDMCVNMMISAAWFTAVMKPDHVLIYHATSGAFNPITGRQARDIVLDAYRKVPLDDCFRRPNLRLTNNGFLYKYYVLVGHMIPAYIVDFAYYIVGRKPRMVRLYKKLHRSLSVTEWARFQDWEWTHSNCDMLLSHMSTEDRTTFYFDPRLLHWPTYIENYCLGTKIYMLNEDISNVPAARAHLRRLRNIRYCFNTILIVVLSGTLIACLLIALFRWFS